MPYQFDAWSFYNSKAQSAPTPANCRREKRFPRVKGDVIFPCVEGKLGPSIPASIVDLSDGGIGLTCLGDLPEGSHFVLRLEPPKGAPRLQLFEVVRARRAGGASTIGARFVRDLKHSSATGE